MKKHSFKIVAALMAILMVFSFTLTACNVETNPSSVNMPEIPFIIPPDNEDKESSRNPGDISDEDLPMIPEEDEGAKIVLPENVDRDILAYTYASISIDLMSYGYEVFNAYVTTERGDEYGIAYSDGEEMYKFDDDEKLYLSTGFLGYSADETVSSSSDLLYVQPIDRNADEIEDDAYGYVLACVEEGIPDGHFILDGRYVKYSVDD